MAQAWQRAGEHAGRDVHRERTDGYTPPTPALLVSAVAEVREMRLLVARLRTLLDVAPVESAPADHAARGGGARLRRGLGVAFGVLAVFAFVRLVDVSAALRQVSHLRVGVALLSGAAFLSAYVVRAVRWRCLLSPTKVTVRRLAAIYQVSTFLNWLLPVQAGELAKSLLLRRSDGVPVSRSLATVGMDRAMDLLPAIVLLGLAPFVHLQLSRPLWFVLVLASSGLALALLGLAWAARRRHDVSQLLNGRLGSRLPRGPRERIEPLIGTFLDTLVALTRRRAVLLMAVVLTLAAVCLDALFCLLAFRAVGVHVSPLVALYGYTLFNLTFILPTPPGHVGTNEVIGLLIFAGVFGVARSGVAAMFLFAHPWTAVLLTTSGLACLSRLGLGVRDALRLAGGRATEASR
jgi:uncharacterized protein (TIRG00374 family)